MLIDIINFIKAIPAERLMLLLCLIYQWNIYFSIKQAEKN